MRPRWVNGGLGLIVVGLGVGAMLWMIVPALTSSATNDTSPSQEGNSEPLPGQEFPSVRGVAASPLRPVRPEQPIRLRIPAVGIDSAVGVITAGSGVVIDPPSLGSAYWLSSYGVAGPTSDNTVYLAGHTCRGRCVGVFSPLLDIANSATTLQSGDQIVAGTPSGDYSYTVTETALYAKASLQQEAELWKQIPGRLVLVTCFQFAGGTSSWQNLVVYAQLNP